MPTMIADDDLHLKDIGLATVQDQKKMAIKEFEVSDGGSGSPDMAVYVGNFTVDYQTMQTRDPDYLHRYSATGDKPEAQALVAKLRTAGASVEVVRGDVSSQGDVDACSSLGRPIGDVVQAAMGLDEALFSRMSHGAWHAGVRPKWQGSVGTATESNYCSANGFLDAFTRHRRSRGRPAVSVGLGMISEVVDLALVPPGATGDNKAPAPAHILTGLEPFGLRGLIRRGFAVESGTTQDPCCGFLAAALSANQEANSRSTGNGADGAVDLAAEYRTWFWTVLKVDVPFLDLMSPKTSLAVLAGFVGDKIAAATTTAAT
ncbi:hypothetical protein RB597_002065 [Gaeumannomyces tritici]